MKVSKPKYELPAGIVLADLKYPAFDSKDPTSRVPYDKMREMSVEDTNGVLRFYYTERFGWCLCTLLISGKGKRGTTERTYGITVKDKGLVTVGRGPHVLAEIEVYVSGKNLERLTPYLELWKAGMAKAGDTRDRISTRRANTINRRRDSGFGPMFGWM